MEMTTSARPAAQRCVSITRAVLVPVLLSTVATARLCISASQQRMLSRSLGLPRAAGTTACRSTTRVGSPTPAQLADLDRREIGRAACRERVENSGGAGSLKKKKKKERQGRSQVFRHDKSALLGCATTSDA